MLDRLTIKNLAVYTAHHGLRFVFPLVATPFLAHTLGKAQFAELALLNSSLWTSTVFMEFGFYLYGVSRVAAARSRDEMIEIVSAISAAKASLAPLAALVYLVLAASAGVLTRDPLGTAIGLVSALAYGASFAWYFQGLQKGMTAVLAEAVPLAVQFGLMLLLVRRPDQLWLVMGLQSIAPIAALAYAIYSLVKSRMLRRVPWRKVRLTLVEAWPLFIERLCFTLYTSVMPLLILHLGNKVAVADYSVGDRFGSVIAQLATPLTQAVLPRVSRMTRDEDGGWTASWQLVAVVTAAIAAAAAGVFVAVPFLMERFFSADFASAIVVSRIFCVNACISAFAFAIANFILVPRGKTKVLLWSGPSGLLFGMAAQYLLVPTYGALGGAFGRLISESTVAVLLGITALRIYRRHRTARARGETSD